MPIALSIVQNIRLLKITITTDNVGGSCPSKPTKISFVLESRFAFLSDF